MYSQEQAVEYWLLFNTHYKIKKKKNENTNNWKGQKTKLSTFAEYTSIYVGILG